MINVAVLKGLAIQAGNRLHRQLTVDFGKADEVVAIAGTIGQPACPKVRLAEEML